VIILAISLLSIAQFKNHARVKKIYQEEKMKMIDFWLLFQKFLPNGTIFLLSLQFESLFLGKCRRIRFSYMGAQLPTPLP